MDLKSKDFGDIFDQLVFMNSTLDHKWHLQVRNMALKIWHQYPEFAPDFLLSLLAVMIEVMGSTAIAWILAVSVCPIVCVVFP